ncbi:MAG TPA: VWA domain-containing protein [Acidobacteriaceae bacterium]
MGRLGSFGVLALSTLVLALRAQNQNPYSFSTQSNLVSVPTQVTTAQGDIIYGLHRSQFVVTDNGIPQQVRLEEAPEQTGLSLVVVVQCSRAAGLESAKLSGLNTMIDAITGAAPREVAVMSYGSKSSVLRHFTSDPEKISAGISAIKPCNEAGAATLDAVEQAAEMLGERENHYRPVILLISETRDHGSHATAQEVIEELGRTNTVVNAVSYSPARDEFMSQLKSDAGGGSTGTMDLLPLLFMAINGMRDNAASELATLSGGEYLNFSTRKGFDQALGHVANQVHNFYLLSFRPQGKPAAGYHALHVSVRGMPDALVRSRSTYWFEPSQPAAAIH